MDLSWLLGHATISYHAHEQSVALPSRSPNDPSTSLLTLCKEVTPACRLNPLLFNGHLQTLWTAVKSYDIPVYYKRYIFEAEEPSFAGTFAVDFAVSAYERSDDSLPPRTIYYTNSEADALRSDDDTPMLVMLHGLTGGSHEIYLRSVLKPMLDAGWEACVVNSRGCSKSKITSGILYNARATWDFRQVVKWLKARFPNRPLFGVGFSLGANMLVNYLGEEGDKCVLNAAVVISNPWNLEIGSVALQRTWLGLQIYQRALGTSLRRLYEEHSDQLETNPRINHDKVRQIQYLFEFDREVQGPTWGYPTEGCYYRDASSSDSLLAVRIPLFCIHAADDPVAVNEALPIPEFKQTPWAVMCTTSLGGHLSWFESDGSRWFAKPACLFLQRMVKDVDFEKLSANHKDVQINPQKDDGCPGDFAPMRRKLQMLR